MRAKQLITVAVATMLLIGGAAALGAASPGAAANDNATDAPDDNMSDAAEDADDDATVSEERKGNADGVGPSDGLPEQVPDHVSEIHETIDSFLSGEVDNLGQSLNDLLSDGETADEEAADGDETADEDADNDEDADSEEDADGDNADETTDEDA
jgi:hypothetical protein